MISTSFYNLAEKHHHCPQLTHAIIWLVTRVELINATCTKHFEYIIHLTSQKPSKRCEVLNFLQRTGFIYKHDRGFKRIRYTTFLSKSSGRSKYLYIWRGFVEDLRHCFKWVFSRPQTPLTISVQININSLFFNYGNVTSYINILYVKFKRKEK